VDNQIDLGGDLGDLGLKENRSFMNSSMKT
jgi:hypothetical protein